MSNLNAIAKNGHDFGKTQLLQMHTEIKPGGHTCEVQSAVIKYS